MSKVQRFRGAGRVALSGSGQSGKSIPWALVRSHSGTRTGLDTM